MEIRGVFWLAGVIVWIFAFSAGTNTQVISPGRRTEDAAPRIVEQPKSMLVNRGEPVTLKCRAEGRPVPEITWYKDGQPLQWDTSRRTLLDSGATLFFLQVVGSRQGGQDGGVYQCVAQNDMGTAYSDNATLEIAYLKSEFKQEPDSDEVISGDSAVLVCNPPRGYPTPEVTWLKDNVAIEPDGNRVKILEDGNLMLKELRKDDEGTYKCQAHNVAGEETSREATLTVQVKPSFINPPQDTITAPGEAAVLRCEVEGDPTPTVTWTKEGGGELTDTRFQQVEDNSLRIEETREEDDGTYLCTAQNIWGTSDARARLRISDVPNFRQAPRDKTVQVGQDARFQCAADGSPPPSISWHMPGQKDMLFTNQQKGRFTVSREGELHISEVQQSDAGRYVCSATGATGMSDASAVLRVLDELLRPPPIIQYGPVNQTLVVGSTATFLCQAAGSPSPSIVWTKDGAPLSTSNARFTRQSGGTLEISGVQIEDSGLYTCLASSNDGETSLSATLLVIDSATTSNPVKTAPSVHELPNAPSQPVKVNATRSSIFIRWAAPSSGRAPSVTGYQVEYFNPDQTTGLGWVTVATNVRGESHQISHLTPAASYMFLVRAVNAKGVGPPSPLSEIITTDDECLSEVLRTTTVEITSITALSPTAIRVDWQAVENEDEIDTYQVRYRLSSGDSNALTETVVGKTWTIITGLDPGMDYTVSLRPQVCGKVGEESPAMAARTMDQGAGPLCQEADADTRLLQSKLDGSQITIISFKALNAYALKVTWQMVNSAVHYTEGYHVKYYETDGEGSQYSIKTIMDQSSHTTVLSDLSPWQQYTISVRPFSRFFCGQESEPVVARTLADIPRGPPQNVNAKSNGTTAILVTWKPVTREQVRGYVEGYHIWCRGNTTAQERNRTIKGNTTLVGQVTGLEAGKTYRVQVAAYNPSGVGPSSMVVIVSLPLTAGTPTGHHEGSALPPPGPDDEEGGVASKPWFYGVIAGIVLVVAFVLIAFVLRRRKLKHATNMTKNPLSLEGATHMTTLTSQYDSQPTGNGHPSWPPDQTWRSNNSSECQSSSLHGNGSASAAVTTFTPHTHPNGSLRSVLGKNQYLQPHHSGATTPAYWLLEAYESKEQMQLNHPEKVDLGTSKSDQYNRNNVPVYAVVDNESEDEDTSPSCPHMAHTLPISQCAHMIPDHCQSLPPQMTEPYASTTLVLPPNIREYMAQKQNVSDTSSGSASGSITYPLPSSAGQQKGRKKPSKKGRLGDDGGPPLPPQRDGSHLCLDCQTGLSDSGSRRKPKTRTGAGTKYPTCNWTEFLPPPPEEPPMMGQDSMTKIKPPPPCKGHPGGHFMGHPNGHSNFLPIQPAMSMAHHQQAPALPMRNHAQSQYPSYPYPQPPQANGLPHTLPVVSRGDEIPHHSPVPTTLPVQRPGLINGQAYPTLPVGVMPGGQPLAPHQVFEDPRHEQLGRELLEFNDDLMSQSEAMSDNEEGTPMLPSLGTNTVISDQSSKLIPEDLEADLETSSNCTGSMLASWASMNGSSTGGSNRNSGSSCSSDGSFCAETDFAAAVTAAAQNAGIPVVGSPPADSTKVGRDLEAGEQMGNGSTKDSRRSTPVTRKGPAIPTSLFPELQQHRVAPSDHYPYHQQQPPATSQRILPPPPSSQADMQQDSVNKNKRRAPPSHDNLFLRDTNDLGLTVTANPMAFAHEEEEGFHS